MGNVEKEMKRRWGLRKERQHGSEGEPHPGRCCLGKRAFISLPTTIYQGTWESRAEAWCALCVFFHHFFPACSHWTKASAWHADNVLYPPFIRPVLQTCHYFSGPTGWVPFIFSQKWSSSDLYVKSYVKSYVKRYDVAHNPQALSNGPPWKILVNTRQGPSGLTFVVYYYHKMRRKAPPGTLTCETPGKRGEERS